MAARWHGIEHAATGLADLRGAGWTVADDPRVERETRLRDLLALMMSSTSSEPTSFPMT
jgi:hypothetical protein